MKIRDSVNIISVRQKQPLGLGHAVLCGQTVIGDSPFAVLLGDEIMVPQKNEFNTTAKLCQLYSEMKSSVVAIMEVQKEEVSKYGIADVSAFRDGVFKVNGFIEKPKPEQTPSHWALPGRYVFESHIFNELKTGRPGALGEIQLTDSMNTLCKKQDFYASTFSARRFDAGDKFGYLKANVELGLMNPELRNQFRKFILETADRLKGEPS
jgi:UTP--glucose-1-phosphate uridylyltransferase